MSHDPATFWHRIFDQPGFVYGTEANRFLQEAGQQLPANARLLSLGEGEGRNSVFLAKSGHDVTAVELAPAGIEKIHRLATEHNVTVRAIEANLADFEILNNHWQAIISIFCHLPSRLRRLVFDRVKLGLVPGGLLIMEGYTPRQLAYGTGGPKELDLLLEPDIVREELHDLELLHFAEVVRDVTEGVLHTGSAAVLQVIARKPFVPDDSPPT